MSLCSVKPVINACKFLGGSRGTNESITRENNVQAIAMAGSFEYFLSRSGSVIGPKYQEGTVKGHSVNARLCLRSGDADGYKSEFASSTNPAPLRDDKVEAVAVSFKPALLLFNGPSNIDSMVNGILILIKS